MTKAERKPDPQQFATEGADTSAEQQSNLEKLAASAATANAAIDTKNNNLAEAYATNWADLKNQRIAIAVIEKDLRSAKSELSNLYKRAKKDGCNIERMKKLAKLEDEIQKIGPDVMDQEMKEVAWLANLVNSRAIETTSFKALLEDTDKVNRYTQGYRAGLAGDGAEGNPYKPGSENHAKWEKGRRDGQVALAKRLFGRKTAKKKR